MGKSPMLEKFRGMRENTPENMFGSGQPSYDVQAGGWMPDTHTGEEVMTEAPVGHSDPSGESYTSQKYRDEAPEDNPAMSMELAPEEPWDQYTDASNDPEFPYNPEFRESDIHAPVIGGEIGMMSEPEFAPQYPQAQTLPPSVYGDDAPFDQPAMEEDRVDMDGSMDTQDPRLSKIFGKYNPYGAANPYGPSAANPYLRKYG